MNEMGATGQIVTRRTDHAHVMESELIQELRNVRKPIAGDVPIGDIITPEEELRDAAQFIQSISPDIPWHVTAFHKDYKMQDPDNTDGETLIRAAEMGYREGLHYVYAGNLPGEVGPYENTFAQPNAMGSRLANSEGEVMMKCLYCQGTLARRETNYVASRKGYHLILNVPAWVCEQCGEPLFDETTVDTIQDILRSVEARLTRLPALVPA